MPGLKEKLSKIGRQSFDDEEKEAGPSTSSQLMDGEFEDEMVSNGVYSPCIVLSDCLRLK